MHAPSCTSAPAPRNRGEYNGHNSQNVKARPAQSQGSVAQRGSCAPGCAKCGRNHPGRCRDGHTGYFKSVQEGHFMRECPNNKQRGGNPCNKAQSSSISPPDSVAPRGAIFVTGRGANGFYEITIHQEQSNSPYVVMVTIRVFNFDVYAL